MPLQDQRKTLNEDATIGATISRLRDELELSHADFREILRMSQSNYRRATFGVSPYPLENIGFLCEKLNLSITRLFRGTIDLECVRQGLRSDFTQAILPVRYAVASQQLARARAMMSLLSNIQNVHGRRYEKNLLRWLQIRQEYFKDPLQFISPLLLTDLMDKLRRDGFSDDYFIFAGHANFAINEQGRVAEVAATQKSVRKFYELLHAHSMEFYDQLFDYRILSITDRECTASIKMKEFTQDIFSARLIGNRALCLYKQGVYATFPGHMKRPFATVTESKCLFRGDPECRYHLQW